MANKLNKLTIQTQMGFELLKIGDIVRCESQGSYTLFYMSDGKKIMASKNIKEYESVLPLGTFFRIHRSFLVNLNHVAKYIKGKSAAIEMTDGSELSVSRYRKKELIERLNKIFHPIEKK